MREREMTSQHDTDYVDFGSDTSVRLSNFGFFACSPTRTFISHYHFVRTCTIWTLKRGNESLAIYCSQWLRCDEVHLGWCDGR
jgi:hypothetical protein